MPPDDIQQTGMMVALYLPAEVAQSIAVEGGEAPEDLHITLAFMGRLDETSPDGDVVQDLKERLASVAEDFSSLEGRIGGLGQFPEGPDGIPVWVPVDAVNLDALRVAVVGAITDSGAPLNTEHGFAPHITLAYEASVSRIDIDIVEPHDVTFTHLTLELGPDRFDFPFAHGTLDAAVEEDNMPWELTTQGDKTCVRKKGEKSTLKCYDERQDAVDYLRALYHSESGKPFTKSDAELVAAMAAEVEGGSMPASAIVNGFSTTTSANWPTNITHISAHAEPASPPLSHFSQPPLSKLERYVSLDADGRIFGHFAGPDECHIGYLDRCVPAPLSASSLEYWPVGTVMTAEGVAVPTGPLALNSGHATGGTVADARAHYDNPDTAIADIVVGIDEHGGWFSGSLRPGVDAEKVRAVLASGVSGEWRYIDGELRLIGLCSVNRPGFPKVSITADAHDGHVEQLVAAGGAPLPHPDFAPCNDCDSDALDIREVLRETGVIDKYLDALEASITPEEDDIDLDELEASIS